MRPLSFILVVVCVLWSVCAGQSAFAQGDQSASGGMSALQMAVACAPPPSSSGQPAHALHVIGAQDTLPRRLFGSSDLLIVDGGTSAGVQLGQEFFVRRENRFGMSYRPREARPAQVRPPGLRTVGWIRVVAVNDTTAIALVQHVCDGILADDFLQPFVAPELPPGADRDDARGEPDFTSLGRIVTGNEDRDTAGAGDFMLIDRGSVHGVVPGARFAVYRDVKAPGLPLAAIGEAVVISTGTDTALTRITRARDAVITGDYVALRR